MTDIDITRLRKILAEATPGLLRYHSYHEGRTTDVEGERRMVLVWAVVDPTGRRVAKFNREREVAAYVATSNAAPALLDELEDLRSEVKRLRSENSKLRYAVHMDVSDDSYTHDNALADAIRERDEAVKRGDNEVIDHGATAGMLIDAQKEITELRAYRDRTEAALREFFEWVSERQGKAADEPKSEFIDRLWGITQDLGLWRDAKEGAS